MRFIMCLFSTFYVTFLMFSYLTLLNRQADLSITL